MYTSLVSSVLFPLHERVKGHQTTSIRRHMEQTQWWPAEHLQALQLSRLHRLLRDAYDNVPYYRHLFDEIGFEADSVRSVDDLARLPFLDKATIRVNTDALKSSSARGLARFNTGGSSGEPLIFYIGKERVSHDVAAKWRATRWWGVDIGDPEIVVWGSPIELGAAGRQPGRRDPMLRNRGFAPVERWGGGGGGVFNEIVTTKPKMLFGYPSALSHFARHADANGLRMDDLGIRVAFVTSERLYDNQRVQISKTFGCPVANGYGGRDAGFIAHQCPHGGMHITAEDIIVEIVDAYGKPVPPGVAGEIVVTHLATRDFPFIRYRTGDVGSLDNRQCSCGRGLPLLKEIHGRSTDFVVAQNGTVMHGLALIYILRDLPQVRAFKIVQESLDFTSVSVQPEGRLGEDLVEKIKKDFKARLGQGVTIVVNEVAEIPAEKSGKYRYVISKVAAG